MSFISKLKEIVSPSEYTDEVFTDEMENETDDIGVVGERNDSTYTNAKPIDAPKNFSYGSSLELKVVRPEGFENVTAIADHLLSRKTVVLNLEDTNKEAARRLLDFLSGVAYAIDGTLKKVTNTTFIITPNNVNVSGEQIQEIANEENAETDDTKLF